MRFATLSALLLFALPLQAQIGQDEYAARRAALVASLPGDGVLLVLGAREPRENYLQFNQAQDFNYLTGFLEPEAALLVVRKANEMRRLLFVQPRDHAREVWTGYRLGVDGVAGRMGLEGRDARALPAVLDSLLADGGTLYAVGDLVATAPGGEQRPAVAATVDDQFVRSLAERHPRTQLRNVTREVARLRSRKSPAEFALLRQAARISALAHQEVLSVIEPDRYEYEVEALAEYVFRRHGADGPGYPSIVGSGGNSTTLHYNVNDRQMRAGEMVTMDMAASFAGYSADITRSVPVSGRYTPEQRLIYEIVLAAQKSAERQVKAGNDSRLPRDSATTVLKAGLARLGLIESPDATYECGDANTPRSCSQHTLYYMHGLSHGIGLDVHDPDQYTLLGHFDVGSAFTIEPGLYVRANTVAIIPDLPQNHRFREAIAPAVRRFADIGVRVEDDFLVTATGVERISADAPREIDEIERAMAKRRPNSRDPRRFEEYGQLRP